MSASALVLFGVAFISTLLVVFAREIGARPLSAVAWLCTIAGAALLVYGLVGFFGAFLSVTGRLPWTSEEIAFPMGQVEGAVVDADGLIYCPSPPWGRIQLYDQDKRFIRGWFVNAFGGTFRVNVDRENHLQVATARRRMLYVFDRQGRLLSRTSYEPRSFSDFDGWQGTAIAIPTPFYLLPLTHPVLAWCTALAGIVILVVTAKRAKGGPM
jgi:hypothetical protein